MENKPDNNRQVFYKNRNIKADSSRNTEAKNSTVLNPQDLIAEAGNPKAYFFPNNLSSYAAGNILRFSIFKFQGGGYRAAQERPGGSDAITDMPQSEKIADIYLPEPSGGSVEYKPEWDKATDNMLVRRLAAVGTSAYETVKNGSITDLWTSQYKAAAISEITRAAANILSKGNGKELVETVSGMGQTSLGWYNQEYREEAFKGIGPRSFAYTFNLIPTSPTDLILISNIIQLFKWSSVPGLVSIGGVESTLTNKLFESPEIIQIRHMTKVKGSTGNASFSHETFGVNVDENDSLEINPWINKHLPSVLTNTSIRYGSESARYLMTYVQDRSVDKNVIEEISSGAPLMYSITLSFRELTVLTKAAINNGY